jgi:hypothetical protein
LKKRNGWKSSYQDYLKQNHCLHAEEIVHISQE